MYICIITRTPIQVASGALELSAVAKEVITELSADVELLGGKTVAQYNSEYAAAAQGSAPMQVAAARTSVALGAGPSSQVEALTDLSGEDMSLALAEEVVALLDRCHSAARSMLLPLHVCMCAHARTAPDRIIVLRTCSRDHPWRSRDHLVLALQVYGLLGELSLSDAAAAYKTACAAKFPLSTFFNPALLEEEQLFAPEKQYRDMEVEA